MDRIYIRDLALRCIIGIYPDERTAQQDVVINIVMTADLSKAGGSDRIDDTVDYKSIKKRIIKLVEGSQYGLIEAMAERIAAICLEDEKLTAVTVTVDKPGALRFARSVAVEINRTRSPS